MLWKKPRSWEHEYIHLKLLVNALNYVYLELGTSWTFWIYWKWDGNEYKSDMSKNGKNKKSRNFSILVCTKE